MTDTPTINLTQLRDLLVASQPSTDLTMEDGGPHFTDHALVSRQRLVAKLLNGALLALIDTAEAAKRTVASYLGGDPYCETDELGDLEETLTRFA